MRRLGPLVALAVLGLAASGASAQLADNASPEQDLDCAIWASAIAGTTEDKNILVGIGPVMGYFIGRYEGQTGKDIDEPMIARAPQIKPEDLSALDKLCQPRMKLFGQRLVTLGNRLQAAVE